MAVHAGFCRRNPREGGSFYARMAVAAVNSVVSHVMFVAELYGLLASNVLPRHIRRTRRGQHRQNGETHDENKRKDTEPRDEIGASMKNLRHFRFLHFWRGEHRKGPTC